MSMSSEQSAEQPGLVNWLAANRNQGGLVLMVAGIVLAAVPTWLASQYGTEMLGIEILLGLLAALWLLFGVALRFRPPGAGSPLDEARFAVLALGGLTGLCIALLGIAFNVQFWDRLTAWLRFGEREGAWKALVAIVTLVLGLAIMFLSLTTARSEERSSPVLRRLIYGYNAVLTGILLFLILAIVNVLAYLKLPAMLDSTEAGLFKLSDRSKQILRSLEKPTKVYLIMASDTYAYDEMRTLLANMQDYSPYLTVESLSPGLNAGRIRDLQKQYPDLNSEGVLVVYGDEPNAPGSFIKSEDILRVNFTGRERTETFEGEARLMTELAFLAENQQKPVIYFANQNAGEFDLNDSDPRREQGIGMLKSRLEKRNMDVRPLKFDVADPKVPDDATIVVLPNPRQPYTQPIVAALQKYLSERKGKLVLLTDVPADRGGSAPETGLETVLAAYKVDLPKERILMLPVQIGQTVIRDPELTLALVARSAVRAKNPVALSFDSFNLLFDQSRVVRPITAPPGGPMGGDPNLSAETLIETRPGLPVWAESDFKSSARQLAESLMKDPRLFREKRSNDALPLAVVVTESPPPSASGGTPRPRLVVFGTANFITNPRMDETRSDPLYFDLFAATLEWLRERPANVGIEPRTYKNYMIDPGTTAFRLVFLPIVLALAAIVGLGVGVWVVRRQ